jgi:hypothetical protein
MEISFLGSLGDEITKFTDISVLSGAQPSSSKKGGKKRKAGSSGANKRLGKKKRRH